MRPNPNRINTLNWITTAALLLMALASPQSALALAGDRNQPIHISSDRAERNDKEGITVYSGAVTMSQGSLNIKADRVVVHNSASQVEKIVASGSPASYQHKPTADSPEVLAQAEIIEYLVGEEQVKLNKNASLTQSTGNTMSGEFIRYNLKTAVVQASKGGSEDDGRVHMVIQPSQSELSSNIRTS